MIVALCMLPAVACIVRGLWWMLYQHDDGDVAAGPPADEPRLDDAPPVTHWDALDDIQASRLLSGATPPPDH